MAINSIMRNPMMMRLSDMRTSLEDLQRQLGTGQKAETYGQLGTERSQSITFRSKITKIDAYMGATKQVNLRIQLLDTSLTRLGTIPTDVRAALDPNNYQVRLDGKTDAQKSSLIALDEVVGLLNSTADGRYLFSGKSTDTKPVVTVDEMLNGTGAKDGLKQVTADRLKADLGTGKLGRLEIATAGDTVSLNRQTPLSSEFGYKIADVETTSSNVTVGTTGTSPVESASVSFTGLPAAGDTVKFELTNPDGSASSLTLTATLSNPPEDGYFTVGADTTATATNFETALQKSLGKKVASEFTAASATRAGENFFDTFGGKMPQRVDTSSTGGDLATATDLRDATSADTVQWYLGYNGKIDNGTVGDADNDPTTADYSTLPRNDIGATVDSGVTVNYGVRANEQGLRLMVQSLSVMATAKFDSTVPTDEDRYAALTERARDALAFDNGNQSPSDIHAEVAVAGKVAEDSAKRLEANKSAMQELLDGVEGIDKEEVAAQILTLQNRMQASYQTTSILNSLSLLNFM
ncbi:hypothetical protein [Oryzibacter oryziterrae]|uniref:hypothetical protein n=1 Tax=Oryzibacter oryziterrae TaxID=2766474 RepID=UPI001F1BB80A|nr:hypothetical protein [Oryzibacter oryziterrae]